ncbi:SGNH/GDSL hydrolase family protein [Lutibacter sp.]|uniref:SGNH/GDSL hydrolase family protein n=1 Tax=Lutibacter sp. TaxID=1925666 RepID=UPI0025C0AD4B|nr:SGNH/GDSL hydrolase family protein [Lutibacter sp.]MBT8317237.1 SGNH/GDSL hydrolase family protein [Lutibacter sp.]
MKKIIILIFIVVTSFSCNQKEQTKPTIIETIEVMETPKTYLALGDSYTIGQSVLEKDRFPVILVDELNKMDIKYNPPKIIAKTGWTTDELKAAIDLEEINEQYDFVSLLIGVNNQFRGRAIEEFRIQFIDLLETAIKFANNKPENVVVVSIPDWGVSPFAQNRDTEKIANEIDAFNAVKKEETLRKGVLFVNITPISRLAKDNLNFIAEDELHFSGEMHRLWVQEIIKSKFN